MTFVQPLSLMAWHRAEFQHFKAQGACPKAALILNSCTLRHQLISTNPPLEQHFTPNAVSPDPQNYDLILSGKKREISSKLALNVAYNVVRSQIALPSFLPSWLSLNPKSYPIVCAYNNHDVLAPHTDLTGVQHQQTLHTPSFSVFFYYIFCLCDTFAVVASRKDKMIFVFLSCLLSLF